MFMLYDEVFSYPTTEPTVAGAVWGSLAGPLAIAFGLSVAFAFSCWVLGDS